MAKPHLKVASICCSRGSASLLFSSRCRGEIFEFSLCRTHYKTIYIIFTSSSLDQVNKFHRESIAGCLHNVIVSEWLRVVKTALENRITRKLHRVMTQESTKSRSTIYTKLILGTWINCSGIDLPEKIYYFWKLDFATFSGLLLSFQTRSAQFRPSYTLGFHFRFAHTAWHNCSGPLPQALPNRCHFDITTDTESFVHLAVGSSLLNLVE